MAQFTDRYLNFYRDQKSPREISFLWPVWVWEVLAPKPGGTRLNLFQRSILGLINCEKTDRQQIADWLGIEEEMVAYIIAGQLIPNGWMEANGLLTDEGKRLLDGDVAARSELTTAYVFQDALSGKFWPRVSQELPFVEPEYINARGFPVFTKSIDRDSGKKETPFVIPCHKNKLPTQNLDAMWEAVQRGNNAIHNQNVRDELETEYREFHPDEIECIEDRPVKAYVLCWMQKHPDLHWTVTDPLAVERYGTFLRPTVFDAAKNTPTFANKLKDYIAEIEKDETVVAWNIRIQADTEFDLWVDFPGADRIPNLECYLTALLRRELSAKDNGDKPWFSGDWEDLITQCQKVFECCFKWMLGEWPLKNPRIIDKHWRYDGIETALHAIASERVSKSSLGNLSRQKPGSIYHAATSEHHNASLRPLIAACLFSMTGHTQHPLHEYKNSESLGLDTILDIAESRNKTAHASGQSVSIDDGLTYAQFTKEWIAYFLNQLSK